ncbi:MAG: hypothetical protein ACQEQL_03055 [Pseudomonadota bacterium]
MQKISFLIILICSLILSNGALAEVKCSVPDYNRFYFDQKAAIFKAVIQDIRPAKRSDFDTVRPADVSQTLYATVKVTEVHRRNDRDLRNGKTAALAYNTQAGAAFKTGQEILVLADRAYGDNRYWINTCNPTLKQSLLPDMKKPSSAVRILKSILE